MMIGIGYNNVVSLDKVVAIVTPDSAPIRRLVQEAKAEGVLIDATCGRRMRSVIVTDSDYVIISAIAPETIAARVPANKKQGEAN